jgi:hypothetical protein
MTRRRARWMSTPREAGPELGMVLRVIAMGDEEPAHAAVHLEPAKQFLRRFGHVDDKTAAGKLDEVCEHTGCVRILGARDVSARASVGSCSC